MDPLVDPLALKLLGQIRQQELMEQAAKGQQDTRRMLRRLSSDRIDVWQEGDSALTSFYSEDGLPPFYRVRVFIAALVGFVKRGIARGIAPNAANSAAPAVADPQCINEC